MLLEAIVSRLNTTTLLSMVLAIPLSFGGVGAWAKTKSTTAKPPSAEQALLDMEQAFRKQDGKRLKALLPLVKGHPLSGWGHYWELKNRLETAPTPEIQGFLQRHAGSYVEDRLRADWLLVLGKANDWANFDREYAHYRMRDDREIACLQVLSQHRRVGAQLPQDAVTLVRDHWWRLRQKDDGCTQAVEALHQARRITAHEIWQKVRLAVEFNRLATADQALALVEPKGTARLKAIFRDPLAFAKSNPRAGGEWITLAMVRAARKNPDATAQWLASHEQHLSAEQRNWAWGAIGREAAMDLNDSAVSHYGRVTRLQDLTDDMLAWQARAALRQANGPLWPLVLAAIEAMSPSAQQDPTWIYWQAKALLALHPHDPEPDRVKAKVLLERIAGIDGFYPQLAMHELGQPLVLPPRPPAPTDALMAQVRQNPSLQRGLMAIQMGLRGPGVREWNYGTSLVDMNGQSGRLTPEQMHAAAYWAFEAQVWDRSINTSERSGLFDVELRFPRPFQNEVVERSRDIDLDPANVYGLIRQESRFIINARSSVGAAGLMQVMPATARWTAKQLGMQGFRTEQLNRTDVNIAIGTGYLKVVLDHFQGHLALAAAAYNAGPSRARKWRQGPNLDGAIWAENVPFTETRDYVKKVLANATVYGVILSSAPIGLVERLGTVGPSDSSNEGSDIP